jgi:hypothetical protein
MKKEIDQNFKDSISVILDSKSIEIDLVDLSTAKQAKLLLDFFNNNRFILAGMIKDTSISPVTQVISNINKSEYLDCLSQKDIKIAKSLLLSKGSKTPITKLTNSHMSLKDVLNICVLLKKDGLGEMVELPTKIKHKTKKVCFMTLSKLINNYIFIKN